MYVTKPRTVHTAVVKKSAASSAPQCARSNVAPSYRGARGWADALLLQDSGDRRSRKAMTEIRERTLDARVAPTRILQCHPDHEPPNFDLHAKAPWSPCSVRPFARDQLAVPSKNGVRRHQRPDIHENSTSKVLTEHGEPPPFIVTAAEPSTVQLSV